MEENSISTGPVIYLFKSSELLEAFTSAKGGIQVFDTIEAQLREYYRVKFPFKPFLEKDFLSWLEGFLGTSDLTSFGSWVYYSWDNTLVHLLPEELFVEVRTNRNQYKITPQEQKLLSQKIVGVIGLSVGQQVAMTIAMERSAGEIRLADFDTIDLSNLNRLRSPITDLGLNKAIACARQIWKIDPYLKVTLFTEGLSEENIDQFFLENGKIHLLVEECDGLDIKILSRYKARQFGVPVIMETNDRCLIDIERFDLEPERPLLHGLIGNLDPAKLKGLTQEDKIEYLLPMVGLNSLSERMKASMIEVQSSICSWPQLASSVVMGGGVAAEMVRKMLLSESSVSGRYYVDLDQIIAEPSQSKPGLSQERPKELSELEIKQMAKQAKLEPKEDILSEKQKLFIAEAARMAPSGGNCQPWKYFFYNGYLLLFHDYHFSKSFLDFESSGTYLAFGAAIENIRIAAGASGFRLHHQYFPNKQEMKLVAALWFQSEKTGYSFEDAESMMGRHTNRGIGERVSLSALQRKNLEEFTEHIKPAQLTLIEELEKMNQLAEVFASGEKELLLNRFGHEDIFERELRWTKKEAESRGDGIDIRTLNLSKAEILALKVASGRNTIEWVNKIHGGEAFKKGTKKAIASSSAIGIISMPFYSPESYIYSGEVMERIWINCNALELSFQPVTQYSYLISRIKNGAGEGFTEPAIKRLTELNERLNILLPQLLNREIVFIFRLGNATEPAVKSYRRPLQQLLIL